MSETTNISDSGHPLRIFLVEDSLDVRELMMENMAMIPGIIVTGVSESEADALSQLKALPCDILIVDIQLKTGNGINLLRQISEKKTISDMLKIICSNNASEVFRRVGRQYGVNHFFDKTSEFPQLYELLKDLSGTHLECNSRA